MDQKIFVKNTRKS